jgi:hypothetical protein
MINTKIEIVGTKNISFGGKRRHAKSSGSFTNVFPIAYHENKQ